MADVFQELEDEWARIVRERDADAAETFLAPDFELRSEGGVAPAMPKRDWIAALPSIETRSLVACVEAIRAYGNAAVVHARLDWNAGVDGRDLTGTYLVADVFERVDERWRASWRLSTRLAGR